jgi:glutamate synthase domain-containing protein 2
MASMAKADAFEIKLGQSAKPGMGGTLPGNKVTEAIAAVCGIAPGSTAHSPARFPDIDSAVGFAERIASLREHFPNKPVGLKLAANHLEADLEAALALQPDFITLDGFGGGTGAAPAFVRDHVGMPLVQALPVARRYIDAHNRGSDRPVSLLATGGIRTPADIIKALALGADACALATAALFALGCEYYRACHTDHCPTGVATQDPALRRRIDVETGAERVANFFNTSREMIATYLRLMGYVDLSDIGRSDLLALTAEARYILAQR